MAYLIARGTPYVRWYIPPLQLNRSNMNYSSSYRPASYGTPGISKATDGWFHGRQVDSAFAPINKFLGSVNNTLSSGIRYVQNNTPSWSPFKIGPVSTAQSDAMQFRISTAMNAPRPGVGPWYPGDLSGGAGYARNATARGEQMIYNQMVARANQIRNTPPTIIYRNAPGTTLSTLGGSNNSGWRSQNLSNISGQSKNKRYANGMNAFAINSSTTTGLNRMR